MPDFLLGGSWLRRGHAKNVVLACDYAQHGGPIDGRTISATHWPSIGFQIYREEETLILRPAILFASNAVEMDN